MPSTDNGVTAKELRLCI